MSETTEKSQVDNIDTKQPDDSTWNATITYARKELSKCLDGLELKPHPNQILETSNRLKTLADTLDKLAAVYGELSELQQLVSKE